MAYKISFKQKTTVLKSILLSSQILSEGLQYVRRYLNHNLIQIRKKQYKISEPTTDHVIGKEYAYGQWQEGYSSPPK